LKLFIISDKIERGDDEGTEFVCSCVLHNKHKPDDWQIQVRKDKVTGIAKIRCISLCNMYPFVCGEFTPSEYHANMKQNCPAMGTLKKECISSGKN